MEAKQQLDMLIRLDHPSIVNLYEVYEEGQLVILILEYMAGGQLYECISQRKYLTEKEVKKHIRVLIDAIRYCHEMSIVHRDIKPENLLLTSTGPDALLKLADFGISKLLNDQQLNSLCGTPIYMAPEIWMNKHYNQKVDIWSIGVVMYYLLSGEYPFTGENSLSLIEKIKHNKVQFQGQVWNKISSRARIMIMELLQKDPEYRPSAKQIQNHIWLLDEEQLKEEENQIHLTSSQQKIYQRIIKSKFIKKSQEIKMMMSSHKIAKHRRMFLQKQIQEYDLTKQAFSSLSQIEELSQTK